MSTGEWIVIGLRLVIPLLILRYWLLGGIVAMVLDALDVVIIELIGHGGFGSHYAELDKILDTYYLSLELFVAWRWTNPWTRIPAIALFGYRVVGVVLFEIIDARVILFIFPNLFENWWIYCVVVMKWFPKLVPGGWLAFHDTVNHWHGPTRLVRELLTRDDRLDSVGVMGTIALR